MSLKKTLKEKTSVSLVDLFEIILPEEKTKYYDLFVNLFYEHIHNNRKSDLDKIDQYLCGVSSKTEVTNEILKNTPPVKKIMINMLLNSFEGYSDFDLEILEDFIEYNERNLIEKNDLSTYKTYDEIITQVSKAKLKILENEYKKQVKTIHEDNEWLIVKPLTLESSVKYGYGTKWCTTMYNSPDYFRRYISEGILVYCINKLNGYKVAMYKELSTNDGFHEISFWDQKDRRVDSMQTNLPNNVLSIIIDETNTNLVTNLAILKENFGDDYKKLIFNDNERIDKFSPKLSFRSIDGDDIDDNIGEIDNN